MNLENLGDEVHRELGSPSSLSIHVIVFWLRTNLGKLNNYINCNYFLNSNQEIIQVDPNSDPNNITYIPMGAEEAAVYKALYFVHSLDLTIRKQLLTFDTRRALSVTTNQHSIKLVSPSEVGKYYASLRKEYTKDFNDLVTAYKLSKAIVKQVTGDDTEEGLTGTYQRILSFRRIYDF